LGRIALQVAWSLSDYRRVALEQHTCPISVSRTLNTYSEADWWAETSAQPLKTWERPTLCTRSGYVRHDPTFLSSPCRTMAILAEHFEGSRYVRRSHMQRSSRLHYTLNAYWPKHVGLLGNRFTSILVLFLRAYCFPDLRCITLRTVPNDPFPRWPMSCAWAHQECSSPHDTQRQVRVDKTYPRGAPCTLTLAVEGEIYWKTNTQTNERTNAWTDTCREGEQNTVLHHHIPTTYGEMPSVRKPWC